MATTIAPPEIELPEVEPTEPALLLDVWIPGIWAGVETSLAQVAEEAADEHPERQPIGITPLDLLARQRALLIDPRRWVQGPMARTADGEEVGELHEGAVAWCNIGSMRYVAFQASGMELNHGGECNCFHCTVDYDGPISRVNEAALEYSNRAAGLLGLTDFGCPTLREGGYWNDCPATTHEDVMRVNALACQLAAYDQRVRR